MQREINYLLHCLEMQEPKVQALVYSAFCYTESFGNVQSREHRLFFPVF